jgi:hypothetical protein
MMIWGEGSSFAIKKRGKYQGLWFYLKVWSLKLLSGSSFHHFRGTSEPSTLY